MSLINAPLIRTYVLLMVVAKSSILFKLFSSRLVKLITTYGPFVDNDELLIRV